jgi:hypothetical protein
MSEIVVAPETFRQYGDIANEMAATVAGVGNVDQAATVAAVVPVFGLIGQDFLGAFAVTQANHLFAVNQLAGVHAATAATAKAGADAYDATEGNTSSGFAAI